MYSIVLNSFLSTVIAAVLCLPFLFQKKKNWNIFFLFSTSVFVINLLLKVGAKLNLGFHFNWTGKILSTAFVLGLIYFLKRRKERFDFGLTLKQKKGSLKPGIIVMTIYCLIETVFVYLYFGKADFNVESHLFQLTLPGISEEIIYRGFYLGLLNQIFPKKMNIFNAQMGYAAIVITIMFALSHGLSITTDFQINFYPLNMLIPLIFGFIVIWIRERTESVLIPVIFHNITNELGLLIMNVK